MAKYKPGLITFKPYVICLAQQLANGKPVCLLMGGKISFWFTTKEKAEHFLKTGPDMPPDAKLLELKGWQRIYAAAQSLREAGAEDIVIDHVGLPMVAHSMEIMLGDLKEIVDGTHGQLD